MTMPRWLLPAVTLAVAGPALAFAHHEAWLPINPERDYSEVGYYDPARISIYDLPGDSYFRPPFISVQDEPGARKLLDAAPDGWVLTQKDSGPLPNPREVIRVRSRDQEAAHIRYAQVVWSMPLVALALGTWLGLALAKDPRGVTQ